MIIVVVGGQYGSEGKGKLVSHIATKLGADIAVRTGGPNAGHISHYQGEDYILRQLPSGVPNPETRLLIGPGALINLSVLAAEIERYIDDRARIGIDTNAGIIEEEMVESEQLSSINARLSSTCSGVGRATAAKAAREPGVRIAKEVPELKSFLTDVMEEVWHASQSGKRIIVEGTQGFGLSLHHCEEFPFCTSRDTTASAFISEVGIAPSNVDRVFVVVRTFPIRVGGNSGPMAKEITWSEIRKRSGYEVELGEFTTVTGKLRRVEEFDWTLLKRCLMANNPNLLALHGVDYLRFEDKGKTDFRMLTRFTKDWIEQIELRSEVRVGWVYTGPDNADIIDRGLFVWGE